MIERRRFYREVSVQAEPRGTGYAVLLDGKVMKAPAGADFSVPTRVLADAVAEEWRSQDGKLRPETMLLTRLCNTALDRVRQNRNAAIEQVLAFGGSDLVCYRADMPAELVRRQAEAWDPLLDWLTGRHGIELRTGAEIAFIQQSSNALAGLKEVISTLDDFHLAGLHAATTLMGSLVIALALMECRLDVEQAFGAALVDDIYQEERWGRDEEMSAKTAAKKRELSEISRFIELLAQ